MGRITVFEGVSLVIITPGPRRGTPQILRRIVARDEGAAAAASRYHFRVDALGVIRDDPRVRGLTDAISSPGGAPLAVGGLWGSCAPILAAYLAELTRRPLLLMTAHSDEADDFRDDIETALGRAPELLPPLENVLGESGDDDELAAERLRLCIALIDERQRHAGEAQAGETIDRPSACPTIVVAPVLALMQSVPTAAAIEARSTSLRPGQSLAPDRLVDWLEQQGFSRCDQVELPGDYARRGGIIDIFPAGASGPARVEFFGDEIDSVRAFDAGTQRSSVKLDAVRIPARLLGGGSRGRGAADESTSFLALLARDTLITICEPRETQEIGRTYWQRLGERSGMIPVDGLLRHSNEFSQIWLQRFADPALNAVDLKVGSLPHFEPRSSDALDALFELATERKVVVLCDTPAEKARFDERLAEEQASPRALAPSGESGSDPKPSEPLAASRPARPATCAPVATQVGVLHRGFCWRDTAFVPHHEIFQRFRQRRTLRRVQPSRPIDSFFDLQKGDYVVHALHGIAKFEGLQGLERGGRQDEFLLLKFADDAVVHVPTSQIHVVQKYIGSVRGKPKLSKLGGSAWKRSKERVAEAVGDLAAELLAIQSQRATQEGVAYPADTQWQREFEGAFPYTETEDQLRTLSEIKADLVSARPMDRLICGDVGFGKTELALRGAFKVIEYGRQVAVLVPTTVLAEQHHQTFSERMADYPFAIESLSRFRSKPEQKRILTAARQGQVDILIGTHRLLSADVRFSDLGLVIIDEEQRFGVDAKEKLKRLRATVDVLTLSATPIPRTLHMAMLGIRDISSLATPPLDRRSIVTQVRMWDKALIREALLRELNRDGQAYFVHNFVKDIHAVANEVRALVPEARVVVGHGQMSGPELEEVMLQFLRREADVLVSTNIIESGIDIATANTIFINRAERFGLADLHQLRGRVGRSKHRAYCYLLLSPSHPVKENGARRLKAIEQYSELGAGFQIAMRDLEIRGAGNILGPEQSGHIETVGYDMYCQLLEQAVRRMRNDTTEEWRPVNLDLGITASIPRGYIRSERQRMDVYKRMAAARSLSAVEELRGDLRDAFGPPLPEVETLLALAEIRALSQRWGVRSIILKPPDVIFSIVDLERAQPLFESGPGSPRLPDPQTVHWRLPKRLLEPEALVEVLRQQLGLDQRVAVAAR